MSVDEKKDVCKVCGKEVGYYKIVKENGKSTHRAFHIGDIIPENATEISKHAVSSTYRNRMRQAFTHKEIVTPEVHNAEEAASTGDSGLPEPSVVKTPPASSNDSVLTSERPDEEESSKLVIKEKLAIIKPAVPSVEYTEVHEFPEGSEAKPELDVSSLKRNKFATISAIARKLTEVGNPEKEVMDIRSGLIARGGDFPRIVNIASEHLRFVENGHPLFFRP